MFDTLTRMGASAAGAYEIERSLRFNSSDSTKLERTPSSTGNQKVWTWSGWVKRVTLGNDYIFSCDNDADGNNNGIAGIYFYGDQLHTYFDTSGTAPYGAINGRVYRDTSAWYHIVWKVDAANTEQKVWVNGVEQTIVAGLDPPDYSYHMNESGFRMNMGIDAWDNSSYANLYFAEVHYCDGQEYQASDFGETNEDTGQWIPKEVSGLTYGTNGFYLNFSDNSNTTDATLGKDSSGNSNNWTPTNFSVSAGVGNDSLTDTPTNNYATLTPLKGYGSTFTTPTNGNLDYSLGGLTNQVYSSTAVGPTGKWYVEITATTAASGRYGLQTPEHTAQWDQAFAVVPQSDVRVIKRGSSEIYTSITSISDGDIIGIALDCDNNTAQAYMNGTSLGNAFSLDSVAPDRIYHLMVGRNSSGGGSPAGSVNFGQRAFSHQPAGFKAWNTENLPEPTILDGSQYFKTVIYTGDNGTARDIAVGFQPDMVWIKNRDQVDWHLLQDSVRGATKSLYVNQNHAENTELANGHVNSFGANGFQVDFGSSGNVNANGEDYASWSWKESASAGFDIVSYTGTGSARTVSHNLGVAPEMIIIKNRDASENWIVYHAGIASDAETDYILLNSTAAAGDDAWLNDTAPTSSQWEYSGGGGTFNDNGEDYIAYCFASVEGYSKIGSFVGNGNENGTFVYTGFEPAYILWKSTTGEHWQIRDNVRKTFNSSGEAGVILFASNHPAEYTGNSNTDFLSNGFKCRTDAGGTNGSGQTHIYLAFAEQPFKYANAR